VPGHVSHATRYRGTHDAPMSGMYIMAALTALCIACYAHGTGTVPSQLWLEMTVGCVALLAGTIILRVVKAPRVRWPLGRARLATAVGGALVLAPS